MLAAQVKQLSLRVISSNVATADFDKIIGAAFRLRGMHAANSLLIAYRDTCEMLARHPEAGQVWSASNKGWRMVVLPAAPVWIFYAAWSNIVTIERAILANEYTDETINPQA